MRKYNMYKMPKLASAADASCSGAMQTRYNTVTICKHDDGILYPAPQKIIRRKKGESSSLLSNSSNMPVSLWTNPKRRE